jgi:hypothetical protein
MYMQHSHKERIKLLDRKGFVKVAIEQGITGGIIPTYNFGNTQVGWPHQRHKLQPDDFSCGGLSGG